MRKYLRRSFRWSRKTLALANPRMSKKASCFFKEDLLKETFEWNLKEESNVLFNWYKGIIFHSWKQPYSFFTLFHTSSFLGTPHSYILQRFLCFILRLELFHKKDVSIVSKVLIAWVGNGSIRAWKIIFQIPKILKTIIPPSRARFRNCQF